MKLFKTIFLTVAFLLLPLMGACKSSTINTNLPKSNLQVKLDDQWQGVCCSAGNLILSNQQCNWEEGGRVMTTVDIKNGNNTALDCPENGQNPVDCTCSTKGERMHGIRLNNVAVVNSLRQPNGAPIYPNSGHQTCIDLVNDEIEARFTSDDCPSWRLLNFYPSPR